jgi:hypothetical protein
VYYKIRRDGFSQLHENLGLDDPVDIDRHPRELCEYVQVLGYGCRGIEEREGSVENCGRYCQIGSSAVHSFVTNATMYGPENMLYSAMQRMNQEAKGA